MERMAWKGQIRQGCKEEYIRRHHAIWPEMLNILQKAGIRNYTIFCTDNELFGYYECDKGVAYAEQVQAQSEVVARWNQSMQDVLDLEMDPVTGAQPKLEVVFRMD
ncbi:MAG: L-rhamnose mutarotase [Oscillospiraceae bacterium]|jgi:L-rhamnose mutarotase|nr:L-rhamnose mutarotase [Oscillospiraceae bacterium]